ncbi:MAG: discoidin domain-containing protein [Vicinamibacterales bacterium]
MRVITSWLVGLGCAACAAGCGRATPATEAGPDAPAGTNILHISWGGIALPDADEETRHWSTWTINLVDGGVSYGWTSSSAMTFPHELMFELAGTGVVNGIVLDTRFEPDVREDGSISPRPDASAVRAFRVLGSTAGPAGPFVDLVAGEAAQDHRSTFALSAPTRARWVKLVVEGNWRGSGATYLGDFGVLGVLETRAEAAADVSGQYAHSYGPILLRQHGAEIFGCYNDGLGQLRGLVLGRTMRLAWSSAKEQSLGSATLVAADDKLYGFWYRAGDRMGSPWNAAKAKALADVDLGACQGAIYPGGEGPDAKR